MRILAHDETAVELEYKWSVIAQNPNFVLLKTKLFKLDGSVFCVAPYSNGTTYVDAPNATLFSNHNEAVKCFIDTIKL